MLEFVIFGVTGILPTLVTWAGFPAETGYNLIAIMNGFSFVGRLLPGAVGDRLGHLNVLLVMTVFTFVSTGVTLLPFGARHIEALYAFSACWGLGSGSFLSLVPVCMGKTCEPKDYGRFYGTMNFVVSFAVLITVPIGGQLLESMGSTPLAGLYMAIVTLGGAGLFAARALLVGFWFDMRAKI
ncbi:Riboflavin transporter MCH5 like protein [Verticillium longisporum]|nr:Riboflavin transporter MCH5 like protein [Verticillium longisporum]